DNCTLICDSHENIDKYVGEPIDLAVYNLGYLPKGDKNITTTADGTISSLEKVLKILSVNGLVSLTLYWGHPEGKEERERVLEYVRALDGSQFHVLYMQLINQENTPPELLLITRKKR
ncbi:MAG: class I SAM-dependent methyltransferase, partial [Erysipelotrichaceae bacterium]|nr:class I SAM-dependent methyltransferase [Erysipelotrichaceae bacterium]